MEFCLLADVGGDVLVPSCATEFEGSREIYDPHRHKVRCCREWKRTASKLAGSNAASVAVCQQDKLLLKAEISQRHSPADECHT